jgi:membrane protein DedA with SNARE-associated domain
MPMAGFVAAGGRLDLFGVIVAGALGSVAGALPWYYLGRVVGGVRLERWATRHGRWLTLSPAQVSRVDPWFRRHCGKAVLLGRLLPALRTLISLPAGLFRTRLDRFLLYTAIGSGLWSAALAGAGYWLHADYGRVQHYLNPAANLVVAGGAVVYLYRVARWRPAAGPET